MYGKLKGNVVPQLYINDETSSLTVYQWQLRGFKRIKLESGEKVSVSYKISPSALELIDKNKNFTVEKGTFNIAIGNSSTDFQLKGSFEITE